jgi:hypothetical protein
LYTGEPHPKFYKDTKAVECVDDFLLDLNAGELAPKPNMTQEEQDVGVQVVQFYLYVFFLLKGRPRAVINMFTPS